MDCIGEDMEATTCILDIEISKMFEEYWYVEI